MDKRIVIPATVIAFFPPLALAIFEVMEWKMPSWVAVALLGILAAGGLIAFVFLLRGFWTWSSPFRNRYALQVPIFRSDLPDVNQWLFDHAERQRDNPTSHLVITDRIIMGDNLGQKRPWLRVRVCFTNLGVNDLTISQPEGYPYFGDEKSSFHIRDEGGAHNVPAGHSGTSFDLDIYVPPEFLGGVRAEVASASGEVTNISLRYVQASVKANVEGSPKVGWSIGGRIGGSRKEVFRPNRGT